MSRIVREKYKSGFFHIMIQGINKEYIFETEKDKEQFLFLMKKYYQQYDTNYITLFNGIDDIDIEILDIENNNENFENAIKCYLKMNNVTIKEIISNKEILYDFISKLISKGYKQKQIANKLNISSLKISKILKKKNYPQF